VPEIMITDEWNDSLTGDYLWSNTNFGEAFSQTMTPLTWSVLQFTLHDWRFLPGYATVGNIAGRPYLNISIFATLFHLLGRSQQDLLDYMEATLYIQLPADVQIPRIEIPRSQVLSVLVNLVKLRLHQQQGIRRLPAYLRDTPGWFERMRLRLAQISEPAALLRLWHADIRPHILSGMWTVLSTATHSADYTLSLRRSLSPLVGDEDAGHLIANLSEDTGLLASLEPLAALGELAEGKLSRAEYLERFGHRGPDEFELSLPRPAEEPEWLERQLARYRTTPSDIRGMVGKQHQAFKAAWERFSVRYPSQFTKMQRRIQESARRARLREQARSEYVRDRWLLRLFALRAAELCGLGEDVFFLRLDEVLDLLGGDRSALERIPERKDAYQDYRQLPNPPAVILGRFDPLTWATESQRRTDFYAARRQALPIQSDFQPIKGAPGSAGVVRLLDSAAQAGELQTGDVLVTAMTDISWTPLFPRLSAVVTDVGAPLSHAAIVARELGIPAVVGCGDATLRLHSGDRVRVDGGRGVVEKLD
jgi:pyruvate,water dikinase